MSACCVCGAVADLVRYRHAEIKGGPRAYVCRDTDACAARLGGQFEKGAA